MATVRVSFLEDDDGLQKHIEPAADGLPDEGRFADAGAGSPEEMVEARPVEYARLVSPPAPRDHRPAISDYLA